MKARIIVTDDVGRTFEGETSLVLVGNGDRARRSSGQSLATKSSRREAVDFELPVRALMKRSARNMSGAQKFTLLVAKMSNQKVGAPVSLKDIVKLWNRMTGPMGGKFNDAHPSRAKDSGWVDSPKTGTYALVSGWRSALVE
jgi:hypothetical protein